MSLKVEIEEYYDEVKEEDVKIVHLRDEITEDEVDKVYLFDGVYIGIETIKEMMEVEHKKSFTCWSCEDKCAPEHILYIDYLTRTKLCENCIEDYIEEYYEVFYAEDFI